jgi:hypothetical protein
MAGMDENPYQSPGTPQPQQRYSMLLRAINLLALSVFTYLAAACVRLIATSKGDPVKHVIAFALFSALAIVFAFRHVRAAQKAK